MKLSEFKRLVEVGDRFRCVYNERIPSRAGETFTVEKVGSSVITFRWEGKPYRFEWPKAADVDSVSTDGITYRLSKGEAVRHELLRATR